MFKIIQKRRWFYLLSGLLMVVAVYFMVTDGLKLGLDFTGGTRMVVSFSETRPSPAEAREIVSGVDVGSSVVQTAGDQELAIRLPAISNDQRQAVLDSFNANYPGTTEQTFESIGPTIGAELLRRAYIALGIVIFAIIAYISWAFRRVNSGPVPAWAYGLSAIVALIHDVVIVVGVFAALGVYAGYEIDSLFVTALLTVLGFSVHDTIVVFDRVRERLRIGSESSFEETVNVSLNQTLVRSINTSLTTLLVLLALYLFGGQTIQPFALALLIGIVSGTYSSIFVASPLLVEYERWRVRRRG